MLLENAVNTACDIFPENCVPENMFLDGKSVISFRSYPGGKGEKNHYRADGEAILRALASIQEGFNCK